MWYWITAGIFFAVIGAYLVYAWKKVVDNRRKRIAWDRVEYAASLTTLILVFLAAALAGVLWPLVSVVFIAMVIYRTIQGVPPDVDDEPD